MYVDVLIFVQALRSTDSQCSADEEPTEGLPNLGTTSPVSSSYSELRQVIKLAILIVFFFIIENLIKFIKDWKQIFLICRAKVMLYWYKLVIKLYLQNILTEETFHSQSHFLFNNNIFSVTLLLPQIVFRFYLESILFM